MLVQNATASQEKLAQAAQSSVATITRLAEVVKLGAASLGSEDPETQVWSARIGVSPLCCRPLSCESQPLFHSLLRWSSLMP